MASGIRLVLTQVPDAGTGSLIARTLVEEGLAACVSQAAAGRSVYCWQGRIEEAEEIALVIKIRADAYAQVEERLLTLHPYETPEIVAIDVAAGLPAYLNWVYAP